VLVEAVAAGLPAIVSPHIGVLEMLHARDALVMPLEPRSWATAIEKTAAAPPVRDSEAIARLRNQFQPEKLVPRWLELYEDLPLSGCLSVGRATRRRPLSRQAGPGSREP
jgi:glycosyltransferase involved in cell wall biosynthesis